MNVVHNTASECRVAFSGACVATVRKLYRLGSDDFERMMIDLSRSPSRYFAKSLCRGNKHWKASTTSRQERHAYDLYTLLLEACLLHLDGDLTASMDMKFRAQRRKAPWFTRQLVHDPKECLEFLAIANECLQRPWNDCLAGPLASCRRDWTGKNLGFPRKTGEVHEVLQTLLFAVLERKSWSGTFFVTHDGYLGIGPESTHPGDHIAVLDGARSPFILKAVKGGDYALLGDSSVLGLMLGEVRDLDERGKLHSREIVLR
jgi:hypothetical protein